MLSLIYLSVVTIIIIKGILIFILNLNKSMDVFCKALYLVIVTVNFHDELHLTRLFFCIHSNILYFIINLCSCFGWRLYTYLEHSRCFKTHSKAYL